MLAAIPHIKYTESNNFFLIAGPCVVENREIVFETAKAIIDVTEKYQIPFIFKASYKKANRTSINSFTGIGDVKALEILNEVREYFKAPVLTDVHTIDEVALASKYVDVLQIPAFLCRQTELLRAAGQTKKWINIKKGQFMSPESMKFVVEKIRQTGNSNIMLTERGTTFGYQDLVVDFRGITQMKTNSCPIILDVTHSLQQPNQSSGITGGKPALIETLAKAGIAVGVDGLFIETHPNPEKALSDGKNILLLSQLEPLLVKLIKIRKAIS